MIIARQTAMHSLLLAAAILLLLGGRGIRSLTPLSTTTKPAAISRSTSSFPSPSSLEATSVSTLFARRSRSRWDESSSNNNDGGDYEREIERERPTATLTDLLPPITPTRNPTIVVLGATGKIGRLVVKQLMKSSGGQGQQLTVVAFVRDVNKAMHVFGGLGDGIGEGNDDGPSPNGGMVMARRNGGNGPKLVIRVADLIPPDEVYGYSPDAEEEKDAILRANSAAKFYGGAGSGSVSSKNASGDGGDNSNDMEGGNGSNKGGSSSSSGTSSQSIIAPIDPNEALRDAISECTTIISCVGTVRVSNWWTDYLKVPFWRIFKSDVSSWCEDANHPYYVNYLTMKKVLHYAELEQRKRDAQRGATEESEDDEEEGRISGESWINRRQQQPSDRIKIVRISDLCVAHKPWGFETILTNVFRSLVFKYQDMSERLLESSPLVDTIVLRPGDLIDDERNVATTSLEVSTTGIVPTPAVVSRTDVAELAVAAATTDFGLAAGAKSKSRRKIGDGIAAAIEGEDVRGNPNKGAKHYSWAVRWASQHLSQPQGLKRDGLLNAQMCTDRALKLESKRDRRNRIRDRRRNATWIGRGLSTVQRNLARRRGKPYAVSVAVSVYFFLGMFSWLLLQQIPAFGKAGGMAFLSKFLRLKGRSKLISKPAIAW